MTEDLKLIGRTACGWVLRSLLKKRVMTEGTVDYVKYLFHPVRRKRIYAFALLKGGPDGGDGGRGGHISSRNKGLWTLFHLKFARHIKAVVAVVMVVETEVQELMVTISSLKCWNL
jgi:hypothetical protein